MASDLEAFISHVHVMDEFRHEARMHEIASDEESCFDETHPDFVAACDIGRAMAAMWAAKLRQDFPICASGSTSRSWTTPSFGFIEFEMARHSGCRTPMLPIVPSTK